MSRRLHIFGAGNHARELAWLAREVHGPDLEMVLLVDDPRYLEGPVDGIEVGLVDDVEGPAEYVVGVGDGAVRRRAATALDRLGLRATTLVHPRVERSPRVDVGPGSVVCAGTVLTTNISLGAHVHVNIGCRISHDVTVEDFVTLSPGVVVAGHVVIEEEAFLGAGAIIVNGTADRPLVIGAGAFVAAGATVIGPVSPGSFVAGVPATPKSRGSV